MRVIESTISDWRSHMISKRLFNPIYHRYNSDDFTVFYRSPKTCFLPSVLTWFLGPLILSLVTWAMDFFIFFILFIEYCLNLRHPAPSYSVMTWADLWRQRGLKGGNWRISLQRRRTWKTAPSLPTVPYSVTLVTSLWIWDTCAEIGPSVDVGECVDRSQNEEDFDMPKPI